MKRVSARIVEMHERNPIFLIENIHNVIDIYFFYEKDESGFIKLFNDRHKTKGRKRS